MWKWYPRLKKDKNWKLSHENWEKILHCEKKYIQHIYIQRLRFPISSFELINLRYTGFVYVLDYVGYRSKTRILTWKWPNMLSASFLWTNGKKCRNWIFRLLICRKWHQQAQKIQVTYYLGNQYNVTELTFPYN